MQAIAGKNVQIKQLLDVDLPMDPVAAKAIIPPGP
jgi:hypothetical protein